MSSVRAGSVLWGRLGIDLARANSALYRQVLPGAGQDLVGGQPQDAIGANPASGLNRRVPLPGTINPTATPRDRSITCL